MKPTKHSVKPPFERPSQRPYDLILFGATGFTGQLTARYIAQHAEREGLRWALAGRRMEALKSVRDHCSSADQTGRSAPDTLLADLDTPESIRSMVSSARLIISTVGPYSVYGRAVVNAAAELGTHYVDITGEPDFMNDTFLRLDEKARETGAAIVNACGFDSVPADLAVWHAVQEMPTDEGIAVRCFVETRARFSGGTLSTVIEALHRRASGQRPVKIPYPRQEGAPKMARWIHKRHHKLKERRRWAVPMPVSDVDIVRRSAMRMPEQYGTAFSYAQFFLVKRFSTVLKLAAFFGSAALLVRFDGFRAWIRSKTPAGTGPAEEIRKRSWFRVSATADSVGGKSHTIVMEGGDPGYDETAKMVSEAAFCLLEMEREGLLKRGVLTPAEAMADPLTRRLKDAGIRLFEAGNSAPGL